MKKMRFSLTKIICGAALLMSGTAIAQRGPIYLPPIPPAVTSGYTHATNIFEDCTSGANGTAQLEANFAMNLASFGGNGSYRVATKLYKGDWTNSGMGKIVTNEVLVATIYSSNVTFPAIFTPIGGTYLINTATFYSTAPSFPVTKNGTYRMTTTLQRKINVVVYSDVYTTPLSSVYLTLDVPPYTTYGDLAEVAHVENLKIGSNFDFKINGDPTNFYEHVTCSASPLMLTNVTNWYGNSGTATLKIEKGIINLGIFYPGSLPGDVATITFPVTGDDLNLTTLFSLANFSAGLRVTYTLPNDNCNGVITPVSKIMTVGVKTAAFAGSYSARIYNNTVCAGDNKPISPTWNITTPMPTGANISAFRCAIKSAQGWQGAGELGIKDLTFTDPYSVRVYEVDPATGVRLPNAPDVFAKDGTTPTVDNIPFNSSGNGAGFDSGNPPFYVDLSAPADPIGINGAGFYFMNYYIFAKSPAGMGLTAFSTKVFCAEVSQFPSSGCTVNMKSYFRIANAAFTTAGTARLSDNNEEEESIEYLSLDIYPNPTTGKLTIPVSNDDINVSMIIIDNLGKQVLSISDVKAKNGTVNIEQLSAGIYFYTINKDNSLYRGKIVKQ